MTISRGQMNRQLYMGGGIMNAVPREQYGFGSIFKGVKKAVKGVTGAVKDIASSDLGKAALAGAAIYYGGGGNLFGLQRAGMSGFGLGNLPGAGFFASGPSSKNFMTDTVISGKSPFSKLFSKIPGGGITAAIGGGSILAGLLTKAQMAEIDEVDPDERGDVVAEKLRQSLTRLGVSGEELERRVAEGVSEYTGYTSKAQGGRVNYAMGTEPAGLGSLMDNTLKETNEGKDIIITSPGEFKDMNFKQDFEPIILKMGNKFIVMRGDGEQEMFDSEEDAEIYIKQIKPFKKGGRVNYAIGTGPVLPPDPTQPVNPFAPKPTGPVLPNKVMASNIENDKILETLFEKFIDMGLSPDKAAEEAKKEFKRMSMMQTQNNTTMAANGGLMRTNYALGTKPEPKESGLGGLPIEADMRYSGGFMPYGKKEKADDVPARLSKNEFVFTADAVRAAGGGSMNEGARKMYQTMKTLEQQNRMMS